VLTGQRSARVEAGVENLLGEHACRPRLAARRVVEHERMEIAVARMEHVADP
jgi:hypothetical protein